jgi:hypothetical protein
VESSTFLVFDSQPNFRLNSTRFQFTDCCSQSRSNRHRYQILLFGGDVDGLSIVTHYGHSKAMQLLIILQPTNEFSLRWLLVVITFPSKNFEPNHLYGRFLFFEYWEILAQKLVIYHLIKSFWCCIWYHVFLLNPLKFHGIVSPHLCIAPYHMHHLTSAFITMSKSLSIWCNIKCILYNLIVIECFRWPLLDCYSLKSI